MLTPTEFVSQWTAPDLAAPLAAATSKPELGEIVVFIDHRSEAATILEFAGLLAKENHSRLINVFTQPVPAVSPPQTFARGTGIQDVIETHNLIISKGVSGLDSTTLCVVTGSGRRSGDPSLTGARRWLCKRTMPTSWLLAAPSPLFKRPRLQASRNPWF